MLRKLASLLVLLCAACATQEPEPQLDRIVSIGGDGERRPLLSSSDTSSLPHVNWISRALPEGAFSCRFL